MGGLGPFREARLVEAVWDENTTRQVRLSGKFQNGGGGIECASLVHKPPSLMRASPADFIKPLFSPAAFEEFLPQTSLRVIRKCLGMQQRELTEQLARFR